MENGWTSFSLKNHIWNFWVMIWMVWSRLFPRHITVLQNIRTTVIKIKLCPKHEDYFFLKKKALDHIKPVIQSDRTLLIEFFILAKCILQCFLLSNKIFSLIRVGKKQCSIYCSIFSTTKKFPFLSRFFLHKVVFLRNVKIILIIAQRLHLQSTFL